MSTALLRLQRPPRDLAGWTAVFRPEALPVLGSTAAALEELREVEDSVDAHLLAETVSADPLLTLKLLAHVGRLLRGRESFGGGREVETVTAALVMLGIPPFFRVFGPQAVAEDLLADQPEALAGFLAVLRRSHRAARFAIGFAVHRLDHDAALIHEAALLHDFAELLLWLHAPGLALQIAAAQAADSTLRSAAAQQQVLGIELAALQHALMLQWRLPGLLVQLTDDHAARPGPQLRNVLLAIRIARHSALGWDNAALPDDLRDAAELLQLSTDATLRLLHDIDDDV
jgi:HD-like signal output (HDOD) protein